MNTTTNITIIVHLFNENLFNEMLSYINVVKRVFSKVTVIITVKENIDNHKKTYILKSIPGCILFKVENKGVDVYPFLLSVRFLREKKIKSDFILKLHTKESSPSESAIKQANERTHEIKKAYTLLKSHREQQQA